MHKTIRTIDQLQPGYRYMDMDTEEPFVVQLVDERSIHIRYCGTSTIRRIGRAEMSHQISNGRIAR